MFRKFSRYCYRIHLTPINSETPTVYLQPTQLKVSSLNFSQDFSVKSIWYIESSSHGNQRIQSNILLSNFLRVIALEPLSFSPIFFFLFRLRGDSGGSVTTPSSSPNLHLLHESSLCYSDSYKLTARFSHFDYFFLVFLIENSRYKMRTNRPISIRKITNLSQKF